MKPTLRSYQTEDDYWRIRAFLREVFLLNDRHQWSWPVTRLDYWYWHLVKNVGVVDSLADAVFLWETDQGRLVAALTTEFDVVTLHVHPHFHAVELEETMWSVAEEHFTFTASDGNRKTLVDAHDTDTRRIDILRRRGYKKVSQQVEYQWRRHLEAPIPEAPVAAGYTLRSLGDADELPARSWASWRAFHPDDPAEDYDGWEWYLNLQRSPLYRRDLDLVAIAPTSEIAAFATIWYDDVTRTGHFVPVAVVPEHQQHGLGRALLTEGMRRLQRMGGNLALVIGYQHDREENELFRSMIGPEYDLSELWKKEW